MRLKASMIPGIFTNLKSSFAGPLAAFGRPLSAVMSLCRALCFSVTADHNTGNDLSRVVSPGFGARRHPRFRLRAAGLLHGLGIWPRTRAAPAASPAASSARASAS